MDNPDFTNSMYFLALSCTAFLGFAFGRWWQKQTWVWEETDPWFKGEYDATILASEYLRLLEHRLDPNYGMGASTGVTYLLGWDAPTLQETRNMLVSKGWFIKTWHGMMVMCHPYRNKVLWCNGDPWRTEWRDGRRTTTESAGLVLEHRPDHTGKRRYESFSVYAGRIDRRLEGV